MFVNLEEKHILVVGAGHIASRRIKALLPFGPKLRIVAPMFSPELREVENDDNIELINRGFNSRDLDWADIAVIATDNAMLNEEIGKMCEERGITKNISTDQTKCDFFFPSTIMNEDVIIGISTGGESPAVTKKYRQRIEQFLEGGE